ncbi:YolD-like family protein [Bacillus marasmi]|uniref:YolD-like family protein n=1 Tax=Bacillus marasmi TaxID=1926279 RepID=UPI0011C7C973|nr:YolD-like family protein [Bacillus marasmi]
MIRDRGRIKWTSMMLPEHVKMLRDWVKEDSFEYRKQLDEQQLEQMNDTISSAMEFDQLVTITHYHSHQYELVIGKIHYWDGLGQRLHIVDRFEEIHQIKLNDIYDVRVAD